MSLAPDDLPRSPSGRVPQWVLDEAAERRGHVARSGAPEGRETDAMVRVAPRPAPLRGPMRSRTGVRRSRLRWIASTVLVLGLLGAWVSLDSSGPARVWAALTAMRPVGPDGVPLAAPGGLRDAPPAGFEEQAERLRPLPPTVGTSTQFTYQATQLSGGERVPVAWSPCRPIHYVVNPDGAPEDFAARVAGALDVLAVTTGLVFVDDGATTEAPSPDRPAYLPDTYGLQWAPVLVGVADPAQVPALEGTVAGVAQLSFADDPRTGTRHIVSGTVYVDAETLAWPDFEGTPGYSPVLLHEVGHLVGLDHVDDAAQLMHPNGYASTFQDGDLAGLSRLGRGACAPGL